MKIDIGDLPIAKVELLQIRWNICWCCWFMSKGKVAIHWQLFTWTLVKEIIQLLTTVTCNLSISKVAGVFNVSEYNERQACELRLQVGILSIIE